MKRFIQLAAFLLVTSCARTVDAHATWCADPNFTPDERTAIIEAAADWSQWTNGRVAFGIEYTTEVCYPAIYRVTHTDPKILQEVAKRDPGYIMFGLASPDESAVRLVVDITPPQALRAVTAHEFGHMLGFTHDAAPGQLMSPAATGTWGPEDQAQCAALGLCDRRPFTGCAQ